MSNGSCQIVKTSEDGKVDGIQFTISGNGVNQTVTTANGGKFQLDNLILCYYNRYSYMRVGDLPLEDIVNNYKGYGLPCFETIRRARQRVQSLFPELSRQCSGCDCGNIRIVIEVS